MALRKRSHPALLISAPCTCTASAPAAQPADAQRSKLAPWRNAYRKPEVNMSPARARAEVAACGSGAGRFCTGKGRGGSVQELGRGGEGGGLY